MSYYKKLYTKNRKIYLVLFFPFGIGLWYFMSWTSSPDDTKLAWGIMLTIIFGLLTLLCVVGIIMLSAKLSTIEREEQQKKRKKKKEEEEEEKERLKKEKKEKEEAKEEKKRANAEEKERQNNIKKLCELHGDEFGEAVYNNELRVGMDKPAVTESWGDAGLKKRSKWYYASGRSLNIVYFKSSKVSEIVEGSDPFELDMPKADVISLWGKPADEKKTVYKTKTKLRWYYFPRTTRQYTTAYMYHVDLENDHVVGWKELE